jgi:putative methyltransferase (TIGR04325 family)
MKKHLKRLVRSIVSRLPWHLRRTAEAAIVNWGARRPPFAGVYASFDEIPASIPSHDQARSAAGRATDSQRDDGPLRLRHLSRGFAIALLSATLSGANRTKLRILDFGGGGGADFAGLLAALGADFDVTYHIVELPEVCEVGRKAWAHENRIRYSSELPDSQFDIVYAWSSIQYVPDPIAKLRELARHSNRAVLVMGSYFSTNAFVRAQVNQSRPYPQWVVSLPELERAMNAEGFRLVFRAAGDENYNVENYEAEYRVSNSASLLFLKS